MPDPDAADVALSDEALIARVVEGDEHAFGVLVSRHQARVFRLARAMTRGRDAAEDVLQQTFLAAWRGLRGFRGEASVRTWLLTIARHAALQRESRVAREPIDDTPIDELGIQAGWGQADPERLAIRSEAHARLSAALAGLDPGDREVLTLRELEGLSGEETALLLGVSLAAVKSRLHRARLRLAAALRTDAASGKETHAAR
ncbi:MAG: RNA polymerase sigma factor [Vicinamibacterales bacterium]